METSKKIFLFVAKNEDDLERINKRVCIQFGYVTFKNLKDEEQTKQDFLKATNMWLDGKELKIIGILDNAIQLALIG